MYYRNTRNKIIECTVADNGDVVNRAGAVVGLAAGVGTADERAAAEAARAKALHAPPEPTLTMRTVYQTIADAEASRAAVAASLCVERERGAIVRVEALSAKAGGGRNRVRQARVETRELARKFADDVVRAWRVNGYKGGAQSVYDGGLLDVYGRE
jgi:hypothetical protein